MLAGVLYFWAYLDEVTDESRRSSRNYCSSCLPLYFYAVTATQRQRPASGGASYFERNRLLRRREPTPRKYQRRTAHFGKKHDRAADNLLKTMGLISWFSS